MNAVVEIKDPAGLVPVAAPQANAVTPFTILMRAIENIQHIDLDKLQRLMELEATWRAAQAKQAYVRAFAQFKKNMPDVIKDMFNKQYESDYSSLANLVNTSNKVLGEYGLNASWDPDQSGQTIKVACIMTHEDGHSERVVLLGPPDKSGTKNDLQAIKSTLTYLEGATFQAITGVVARSASTDDDGNGAGAGPKAPEAPKLPDPPAGYAEWADNLAAVVDEGRKKLLEVWKGSDLARRTYMAKYEAARWKKMKKDSEKVPQ